MSSNKISRIKGVRNLNQIFDSAANPPQPMVPFGTQGYLVDMLSQLDLEEQLKIGSNHWVEIEENIVLDETNPLVKGTIISEWYYTKDIGVTENKEELKDYCSYSIKTKIKDQAINTFIGVTYDEETGLLAENTETFITAPDQKGGIQSLLAIELYKGDFNSEDSVLIHTKDISIKEPSSNLEKTTIIETLNREGGN